MNILIAEDEKDLRNLLQLQLEQEGYRVLAAADGREALSLFYANPVDIAVLDVMMPGMDGFNLLRHIREKSNIPVLFLTARAEEMDKVIGLGLGADDYLAKPFGMAELIARIAAHLRRSREYSAAGAPGEAELRHGDLILDRAACCVYKVGEPVELNAKEYLLLKYFMEHPGRVFTKQQLYRAVWEEDLYFDDNTIMVHISHLRGKIEPDPKNPIYIRTIRGIGYRFQMRGDA